MSVALAQFPWTSYDTMVHKTPWMTVSIPPASFTWLFKNFSNSYSTNYRKPGLTGSMTSQALMIALNDYAIEYGPAAYLYTGPAINVPSNYWFAYPGWPANPLPSGGALVWAYLKGYLQFSPVVAADIQSKDYTYGIIPKSWWMMYGKPILEMAAIVGIAYGGEELAAGSGGSSGLAPTAINYVPTVVAHAAPIAIGSTAPITVSLSTISDVGAVVGAGSGLSTAVTAAGAVSKGAGLVSSAPAVGASPFETALTTGEQIASTGEQVIGAGTALAPLFAPTSSLLPMPGQGGPSTGSPAGSPTGAPSSPTAKPGSLATIILLVVAAGGAALLL